MTTENEGIKKQYMDDSYRFQLSTRKEKQDATEEWCRAELATSSKRETGKQGD